MPVSFAAAARLLGKSRNLLVRLRNDGRLGDYIVPSSGPGVLDKIEMAPPGHLPLAEFCELWSRYHSPAGGEEAEGDLEGSDGVPGLPHSRRVKLHFDAALAKLTFERSAQQLVGAAEVEKVLGAALQQTRARINAITPRILAALPAVAGALSPEQEAEVRALLNRELQGALVAVAAIRFTTAKPGAATTGNSADITAA